MKNIIKLFLLIIIGCSKSNRNAEHVDYIEQTILTQNWDDFIEYRHGDIPLIIISVHGGNLLPDWIETRTCQDASIVTDLHTKEIALKIESHLKSMGFSPYIVLNNLHRKKLDLNRTLKKSNCGDMTTEIYWNLFHDKVDNFRNEIQNQFGSGLVIDIHGHSHKEQRIELGYLLSSSELRMDNSKINGSDFKNESSVKSLLDKNFDNLKLTDLLSGELSMGSLLTENNYASVPSKNFIAPKEGELYFSGGYNTEVYGSKYVGTVDAIQVELNMNGIRDTDENRSAFSESFAEVIVSYLRSYYISEL